MRAENSWQGSGLDWYRPWRGPAVGGAMINAGQTRTAYLKQRRRPWGAPWAGPDTRTKPDASAAG